MAYQELNFRPGVNKENTPYTQEGDWVDSDKIRFRSGKPEKIGGWQKYLDDPLVGTPRASYVWRILNGSIYTAFATQSKVYVESGGQVTDITPIRTTSSLTDAVSTSSGSTTLTITDISHGADDGAFVTISGADSVGGVPAGEINDEHQVTVIDGDTYTITVTTAATSTVASGGGSFDVEYQINPGPADSAYQYGWGAGKWSVDAWGTPRDEGIAIDPRLWSLQNWGEDLVLSPRGGAVYIWDATTPTLRATQITQAPHKTNIVLVTKDRHMVCFGCNEPGDDNALTPLDALQIRWSQQENFTDWTPTSTNTAGSQLLTAGTEIIAAANTENQVLIWTDEAVESMQFIGPPFTFGFAQVGTSSGIASSRAWAAYNNVVYWMGENAFYVFQGGTGVLPCTVQRYVFEELNIQQKDKIFTALDRENHEIMWFYPTREIEATKLNGAITAQDTDILVENTAGFPLTGSIKIEDEIIDYDGKTDVRFLNCSRGQRGTVAIQHGDESKVTEPDFVGNSETCRYVSYNVIDKLWWIGRLERTTWVDRGSLDYPIATDRRGFTYNHEFGRDADGDPLVASVTSADFDIGQGDSLMFVRRFVPDFFIEGSLDVRLKSRYYPLSDSVKEVIGTVQPNTSRIDTRIRGRQLALRIRSSSLGDYWKYGDARIDMQPDGRR